MNNINTNQEEKQLKISEADLQATNDLRKAIYDYEFKTITMLQILSGGGASVLVGFLSHTAPGNTKIFYLFAMISFAIAIFSSVKLSFISPAFLDARFRQSESIEKTAEYKKYSGQRECYLRASLTCIIVAIIFATLGWFFA